MTHEGSLLTDVSKIFNGEVSEIPFEFDIVPENTEKEDLFFPEPVKVTGKVSEKAKGVGKTDGYVELEFTVSGSYNTHCARCAKDLSGNISVSKKYGVTKRLENDSDDFIEVGNGLLDVYEYASSAFYLELPAKVLCKDDCKGLCPVCGSDLNERNCSCKKNIGANTLEGLKKLLDN